MKKIIISPEVSKKIQEVFGVTQPSVSHAMNFKRNSQKAVKMRRYALANGGVKLESADEHSDND